MSDDRERFSSAVREALAGNSLLDLTVRVRPSPSKSDTRWLALRGC